MTIPTAATPRPSRILTLAPEDATGLRRFIARWAMRRMGGVLPGIGLYDPENGFGVNWSDGFAVQPGGKPAMQMSRLPWTEEWCLAKL